MTQRIPTLSREHIPTRLLGLPAFKRSGTNDPFNIYRTLAQHPDMVEEWLGFADALRFRGVLPPRDRELLILRTSVNCNCEYEWGQHVPYARDNGVTESELQRLHETLNAQDWGRDEFALLSAADELHRSSDISDLTWATLARKYDYKELIEVSMVVGQYHLVSFVLNAFRVENDPMLVRFPREAVETKGSTHGL